MNQQTKKTKVQQVLEDTEFAYSLSCETEHLNTDYADYVGTQALRSFQRALNNPDLTYDELCKMLRGASSQEAHRQCKTPWSMFMANHIQKNANGNNEAAMMNGHANSKLTKLH